MKAVRILAILFNKQLLIMKSYLISHTAATLLLALAPNIVKAQKQPNNSTINSIINNHNPTKYIKIPNTNIFIIPPEGSKLSDHFSGLLLQDSTSIIFSEINDPIIVAKLPPIEKPDSVGAEIKLLSFKKVTVKNLGGAYLIFRKDKLKIARQLIFGNDKFRVIATAVSYNSIDHLDSVIAESFNTIYYEYQ